jgi:16S rRNA (adenine1518-N6/adenine1519-N6)-dimethyltransferase
MRQKWGQNFLTDDGACRRVVDALGAGPEDAVLEIGPGRGALTRFLAGRVKALTVVELDRGLAEGARGRFRGRPGFQVEEADFLDWPLPDLPAGSLKVISNLPYSAANAILRKLLDWPAWRDAVVMVQKEVAVRITARPGSRDYGILSLAVQAKAEPKCLFDVGPRAFTPPPKVTSTVLRLTRLDVPRVKNEEAFFRVVHAAFGQRRKTLANSLSHGLELEKPAVEAALKAAGVDPGARAETLPLETYDLLSGLFPGEPKS